jgi:hypothetical protein
MKRRPAGRLIPRTRMTKRELIRRLKAAAPPYRVGDTVEFRTARGDLYRVVVTELIDPATARGPAGRRLEGPGFIGVVEGHDPKTGFSPDSHKWGYDTEITRVIKAD